MRSGSPAAFALARTLQTPAAAEKAETRPQDTGAHPRASATAEDRRPTWALVTALVHGAQWAPSPQTAPREGALS